MSTTSFCYHTLETVDYQYIHAEYKKESSNSSEKTKGLKFISIDEFYIGKKHKFLTFVTDLSTGRIVFVGDGKKGSNLEPFFGKIKKYGVQTKAASIDIGKAYITALMKHMPLTEIVFDHFHIVKLVNTKLNELRKQMVKEAEVLGISAHKGTSWTLLKKS
ncbi:transposase [Candidatus Uabimicrobium sp. HlEnr_7]|uniref:transposase n=1 Tax=Candidatus Uabimicrobium helgolandensis TaxID=3095367 RepID=UPI0035574F92